MPNGSATFPWQTLSKQDGVANDAYVLLHSMFTVVSTTVARKLLQFLTKQLVGPSFKTGILDQG